MAAELTVVGLMSGTSMDGVDAALLVTDGETVREFGPTLSRPYPGELKAALRAVLGGEGPVEEVERRLTVEHAEAVGALLAGNGLTAAEVDLLGFHGHTILHQPDRHRTWQIGDGALLAELTGIDVVCDFRSADVAAGGQGAPLAPLYHRALAAGLAHPLAVLNIGGVANVTWLGEGDQVLAFDTGPGNALIDDWMRAHGRGEMDKDGALAAGGRVMEDILDTYLHLPYFEMPPPKSLDRDDFDLMQARGLSVADGAATLTAFTVEAVAQAQRWFPAPVQRWLVCGGGRHNRQLMRFLERRLEVPVESVEAVGWRGDSLEAEAFGFLAVRSRRGLPLSEPGTTGVARPLHGGRFFPAR